MQNRISDYLEYLPDYNNEKIEKEEVKESNEFIKQIGDIFKKFTIEFDPQSKKDNPNKLEKLLNSLNQTYYILSCGEQQNLSTKYDYKGVMEAIKHLERKFEEMSTEQKKMSSLIEKYVASSYEGETALLFPEENNNIKKLYTYLIDNAIEFELLGDTLVVLNSDAEKIKSYFHGIEIKQIDVVHASELPYDVVTNSREKYKKC